MTCVSAAVPTSSAPRPARLGSEKGLSMSLSPRRQRYLAMVWRRAPGDARITPGHMSVDRYIEALKAAVGPLGGTDESLVSTCHRAAQGMYLVHGLRDVHLFESPQPRLLSPLRLRRSPSEARRFAGTDDAVFFYVGPLVLRTERLAALVFRPGVEVDGAVAAPWDSGGLYRRFAQERSPDERRALLSLRTMPAPDYRRALAATVLLRFGGPEPYLRSQPLRPADPDGVYDGTPPSFTYEARFPGGVDVLTRELAFVAARREVMTHGLMTLRGWCLERDIPFEVIEQRSPARTVVDAVLEYGLRQVQ